MRRRALSLEDLGAWLLKARPASYDVAELVGTDFAGITQRCVRPSYRLRLIRSGQPVLLWFSGGDPRHPAGVYACGVTASPLPDLAVDAPTLSVRLHALAEPVLRTDLLTHPVLRDLEVLRMPAGSNPSYLTRQQWAALGQLVGALTRSY